MIISSCDVESQAKFEQLVSAQCHRKSQPICNAQAIIFCAWFGSCVKRVMQREGEHGPFSLFESLSVMSSSLCQSKHLLLLLIASLS